MSARARDPLVPPPHGARARKSPSRGLSFACRACSTARRCKSSTQPDGGEGLAKRKGVAARRGLKEAWNDQQPRIRYPKDFHWGHFLWNWDQLDPEETVYVVTDPLAAIQAYSNGTDNIVSFLGEVTAEGLEALAVLMREEQITKVELL